MPLLGTLTCDDDDTVVRDVFKKFPRDVTILQYVSTYEHVCAAVHGVVARSVSKHWPSRRLSGVGHEDAAVIHSFVVSTKSPINPTRMYLTIG